MRQVVSVVLRWAYLEADLGRVHAYVRTDNFRSLRLLESLRFQREGSLRNFRICRGRPHDFYIYALLRPDWQSARKTV